MKSRHSTLHGRTTPDCDRSPTLHRQHYIYYSGTQVVPYNAAPKLKFTLHQDAPIAGIGMLPVAAAAVNRVTSSGQDLGPDQRITAFEALRAITADAAWQYFEEDRKGTLEVGKLADLVILSADPLAEDPMTMADIKVVETIKEGQTIFRQES